MIAVKPIRIANRTVRTEAITEVKALTAQAQEMRASSPPWRWRIIVGKGIPMKKLPGARQAAATRIRGQKPPAGSRGRIALSPKA